MSELLIETNQGKLEIGECFNLGSVWVTIESQYAGSMEINREQAIQITQHLQDQFNINK